MPSKVWGRDPQEAYREPYEYEVQQQFVREARSLFVALYRCIDLKNNVIDDDDRSATKAVRLLAVDALDSLRGCLEVLARKEHRIAGKLFRDVMETMDLASYFHSASENAKHDLAKWYEDKIIQHSRYRAFVKKSQGDQAEQQLAKHYQSLSRFTHRSYRAILDGYSLSGDRLVHDRVGELFGEHDEAPTMMVLPQTISSYFAMLANLTLEYAQDLMNLGLVSSQEVVNAFSKSLESATVPRRFTPREWLSDRLRTMKRSEEAF